MEQALLFARNNLLSYAILQYAQYKPAPHHRLIARALERVTNGECKRLMIFMPPRHGKSQLASEFFPAWYLGHHPDHYVIFSTYAQEFADDFGRKVRNQLQDPIFRATFPECSISSDSASASKFNTEQRGSYFAVGAGGPITGRGAHVAIIDDPTKGREDAESEVQRRKQKEWYQSVLRTRLMPGGAIVVIQCMTGDTNVLMADGSEKQLRHILIGDKVATYKDGKLSKSKVMNWANQGSDSVYKISMKSGTIVRANERHPFLVSRNGGTEWVRLKNLKVGDSILKVTGVNGKTSNVVSMDVHYRQNAKECATLTTIKNVGQMVKDLLLQGKIRLQGLAQNLNTVMESILMSTIKFFPNRMGNALFANAVLKNQEIHNIGMTSYASITTTKPEKCEDCYVTTATSRLAEEKHQKFLKKQQNTSDFINDEIVSIEYDCEEDVFDIQIEETENFIANGLVSHNTRWHEDDLAGWLQAAHSHENWEIINLPAIDEEGKPLWPEMYDAKTLEGIRDAVGSRDWNALYQQNPIPDAGDFFKREWFRFYDTPPTGMYIYGASDFAVSEGRGDFTEHGIFGIDSSNNIHILDWWSGQTNSAEWINAMLDLADQWKPMRWFGEAGVIRRAVEPQLAKRIEERSIYLNMEWMASMADKSTRAQNFQGRAANNKVYLPRKSQWAADLLSQLVRFPAGLHDDKVDVCSLIGRGLQYQSAPTNMSVTKMDAYREKKRKRGSAWSA